MSCRHLTLVLGLAVLGLFVPNGRLGAQTAEPVPQPAMESPAAVAAQTPSATSAPQLSKAQQSASYVGSEACKDCHQKEYENYSRYAKKAKSWKSVQIMASDLAPGEVKECYGCHTTGYGRPGGFVSIEKTPGLANAGCEVCHGPGSAHVDSGGDPSLIRRNLTLKDCETCHNSDRVASFNFKPLLFGGAH
ncbi:cytochrome c family protein [Desulfovibrio sp. X2]|uniref:cytochrome c family protein n=1 Tax=Desulfovibrio sp. X2 TaxID=941449 RepID=UPI000358F2F7|nr:cytochrome c family protein [Desulfovibrio sp. X2]EPR44727.1 cytochrome c family protein [Desulfovibrio sp. X2]